MTEFDTALDVRAKILGVLLRDARQHAGLSVKQCAELIGLSPALYGAYESGEKSPSLPELEVLAYAFEVPLAHFRGQVTLAASPVQRPPAPGPAVLEVRDRLIGAHLRQARLNARLKLKDFAETLGLSTGTLSDYEYGHKPVPLPELEVMVNRLGLSLEDLLEAQGVIGEWENSQRLFERFKQLSPELRAFVVNPINEQYLRLALRLSEMPADHLRTIATSLLDITY